MDVSGTSTGNGTGEMWSEFTSGARTVYAYDNNNLTSYGYLYNWYAADDSRGICPTGWHVPTNNDWETLINFLGADPANKSREADLTYWNAISTSTNQSGFSARGGGGRIWGTTPRSQFLSLKHNTYFWSATEFNLNPGEVAHYYGMIQNQSLIQKETNSKKSGAYIRCLKD